MNFLTLSDPLLSVLFENDDILAIDKPYGIATHTNDSKVGNEDFVVPGLIEIYERQLKTKLHIIHRLDQTTTGVIIFGKSIDAAKKYQQYFRNRETKKTYVFITASRSTAAEFSTSQAIEHKGAELEARTDFKKLKPATQSADKYELWQANPHTGRNHQIRIHASQLGLAILGDSKYEGAAFPFICLHNRKIEFPNGVVIESRLPVYFDDLGLLENAGLCKALHEIDRRRRLFSKAFQLTDGDFIEGGDPHAPDECLRLIHSASDGLTLDQFGKILVLSWYKEIWTPLDEKTFTHLATELQKPVAVRFLHAKMRDKTGRPEQEILLPEGFPSKTLKFEIYEDSIRDQASAGPSASEKAWTANEGEALYELRLDATTVGLFLDQRLQRKWLRENSNAKTVLNLFSYTGGHSVSAALGGACEVVSVDSAKSALNWSRRNFQLNHIETAATAKFLNREAQVFLDQMIAKNRFFDLVICDPPAFSRGEKGIFKIENDLDKLLASCLKVVGPSGVLVFSTNFEDFFIDDLRKAILKTQVSLKIKNLELNSIQPSLDFELPGARTGLKSFLIRKLSLES